MQSRNGGIMTDYETLIKDAKKVKADKYQSVIDDYVDFIMEYAKFEPKVVEIFKAMLLTTASADNVISDSECQIISKIFKSSGLFQDAKAINNYIEYLENNCNVAATISAFRILPESVRDRIVLVCMLLALSDEDYSEEEEMFLRGLSS